MTRQSPDGVGSRRTSDEPHGLVLDEATDEAWPLKLECSYPARPETVAWIRDAATKAASQWGAPPDTCVRIRLVTSELATHALAASDPSGVVRVCLIAWPQVIRVGVWDASPDGPTAKRETLCLADLDALPADHDFAGWSQLLVREMASDLSVERTRMAGKYVWATFDLPESLP